MRAGAEGAPRKPAGDPDRAAGPNDPVERLVGGMKVLGLAVIEPPLAGSVFDEPVTGPCQVL